MADTVRNITATDSSTYWVFRSSVCCSAIGFFLSNYARYNIFADNQEVLRYESGEFSGLELGLEAALGWEPVSYALQSYQELRDLKLEHPWRTTVARLLLGIDNEQQLSGELLTKFFVILDCLFRGQAGRPVWHSEKPSEFNVNGLQDIAQALLIHFVSLDPQTTTHLLEGLKTAHVELITIVLQTARLSKSLADSLLEFGQLIFSFETTRKMFGTCAIR